MNKDDSMHRLLSRTTRPRGDAQPREACLDTETLAAWADGSLTTAERAAAETHVADCDRCLTVVAAIAKTTPPASVNQHPSWLSLRWLVPLTTAAVAITAWILIQPPVSPSPPSETPAAKAVEPAQPPAQKEQDAPAQARSEAPQQNAAPSAGSRSRDQAQRKRAAQSADKKASEAVDIVAEQVPPPAAAPAAPAAAAAGRAEPIEKRELEEKRADLLARTVGQAAGVIVSPDPNIRWRVVARSVERSTDAGRTWQAQPTGTTVDLLAASAPAPSVCWIVGRTGVVLLSTDGETWRQLSSPDATADLVAVTARDALSATVTTADGRRYTTTDAGRTWTLEKRP